MVHILKEKKIARIASVAYFMATQLGEQVDYLKDHGMNVVVISAPGPELARFTFSDSLQYECVEIPRSISVWKDIAALVKLFKLFNKYKFDMIHSTTPKAGLLSALAGLFANIPVRIHTFTGQPWVNRKGIIRKISRLSDKIIGLLNTKCYADSRSQMDFLIQEGIVANDKVDVIGAGSLAGVNLDRFNPDLWDREYKERLRYDLGVEAYSKVLIFIGRITREKGIIELLEAFKSLIKESYDVDLLLLGPLDQDCGGRKSASLDSDLNFKRIHYIGYDNCPEKYLAISDILCLPSYREGFGTVVIEAAAMGIPCVGTNIYGLKDSIDEGHTGILVPPQNSEALGNALKYLLDNPELIVEMGNKARQRAIKYFDARTINKKTAEAYAYHLIRK
jgi:glycosyltransferase involved in cell wall biosynthesis